LSTRIYGTLAAIGGVIALASILLPWYNNGVFHYNLLQALTLPVARPIAQCSPGKVCVRPYLSQASAAPSSIPTLVCTFIGGIVGVVPRVLNLSRKFSVKFIKSLVLIAAVILSIGLLLTFSDPIARSNISSGPLADGFSLIFLIVEIFRRG